MPKILSTDDGMTNFSSDHGLTMAGSVSYIPVPGLQGNSQPAGVLLGRELSDKVKALIAGPGRSTAIMYRSRKEHMLKVGDMILDESLSRIIEEVFDILDISSDRLSECQRFFTSLGQKTHYYDQLDVAATFGEEVDLGNQGFEGIDVFKLMYAVCRDHPDATEDINKYFRSILPRLVLKYFQHPLRPPPTNMIMRETWQGQPQKMAGASSTSPSTAPDHYSRLLIIARDGGLEVDAPASLKDKKGTWLCRMTMYKVTTTENLRMVKIPMEASRGYGESSIAARQDAAKQIIRQLHNIEK
ncbi:hypothetical protein TWF192_005298 [Orbilia oligospora]|uniref:Uncharacterized protein n=2 Tax=Orbilia oligospora TaxID=2813651 RepID=A0A6G1M9E0_ORBOL|nr:hypothetical protein TWF191_008656 [Orbilia oligospora]KAF3250276.1 hypothetical protein TWF192_005298 [Orbilia oligospora]